MNKHTPGPWKAEEEEYAPVEGAYEIMSKDGRNIAKLPIHYSNIESDACLIAAAPELLNLLQAALLCLKNYEFHNSDVEPARDMVTQIEQALKECGL